MNGHSMSRSRHRVQYVPARVRGIFAKLPRRPAPVYKFNAKRKNVTRISQILANGTERSAN